MSEHILSLSYGKDSCACLGAIEQLGWPLDRIVHAEVWATDTIHADMPPMVEFKTKADAIIKKRCGIEVEHICAINKNGQKLTYERLFYHVRKRGYRQGQIVGFPFIIAPECNKALKMGAINRIDRELRRNGNEVVQYVGIAADEPNRFHNLTECKKSPLVEAGWDETFCRKWCERNGLLSPVYTTATRGGVLVLP